MVNVRIINKTTHRSVGLAAAKHNALSKKRAFNQHRPMQGKGKMVRPAPQRPKTEHQRKATLKRDIKKNQKREELFLPKAPFKELVHRIISEEVAKEYRQDRLATLMLQDAFEQHMTNVAKCATKLAEHSKRQTTKARDVHMVYTLQELMQVNFS